MAREADTNLRELNGVRRFVQAELNLARGRGDARRALGLKARLRQVDAALQNAQQHRAALRAAARAKGGDRPTQSYTIVTRHRSSPTDPAAQGAALLRDMARVRKMLRRQVHHARERRDMVKASCASQQLRRVESLLDQARARLHPLGSATARGERDLAEHEITILSVLRKRVMRASAQYRACASMSELGRVGEQSLRATVPQLPKPAPW